MSHEPNDMTANKQSAESFAVVFKKLAELQDTEEAQESSVLTPEFEEIEQLRHIIEEATAPDCFEFASS